MAGATRVQQDDVNAASATPVPGAPDEVAALLKVQKGSRVVPILLLLVSALAFLIHGLPSKSARLVLTERFTMGCASVRTAASLAAGKATGTPEAIEKAKKQLLEKDGKPRDFSGSPFVAQCANPDGPAVEALAAEYSKTNVVTQRTAPAFELEEIGGWSGLATIIMATIKEYLDAIGLAAVQYWQGALATVAVTAVYALVPGVAGLVYRRAFWVWFGLGFIAILAIQSVSSSLGRLLAKGDAPTIVSVNDVTAEKLALDPAVVDAAADMSILLVAQLVFVLLSFRLRRHSTRPPAITRFVPPARYNQLLFLLLVGVAIELVFNILGTAPLWNRLWAALPFNDTLEWLNMLVLGLPFLYAVLKISQTWTGKQAKNIVICLDGTSNTPDQYDMGVLAQTNVFKLFKMLKSDKGGVFDPSGSYDATLCKTYGERQVAFYYTGIGNKFDHDPLFGTLFQATGIGASGIIDRAYLDLIRVWRPGDRVFIVGFSRGAASARILSRAIAARGAPSSTWTLRLFGRHWTIWPSKDKAPVSVDVLGCWDTVGSFGLAKTIAGINFQKLNVLHDMTVPDNVVQAYHMVALDEDRLEFAPTLMEPDPIRPERIIEVWFPGTHAGVGGGFAADRLPDVPLAFLLEHVSSGYCADGTKQTPGNEAWGLMLSAVNGLDEAAINHAAGKDAFRVFPDVRGQLRVWISSVYNYGPRQLPLYAVIHESVFDRMKTSEPVYAPQSLFDLNDALDDKRDLVTAKVKKLEETNSMDPAEREAVLAYNEKLRLTRWPAYWERVKATSRPRPVSEVLDNARLQAQA